MLALTESASSVVGPEKAPSAHQQAKPGRGSPRHSPGTPLTWCYRAVDLTLELSTVTLILSSLTSSLILIVFHVFSHIPFIHSSSMQDTKAIGICMEIGFYLIHILEVCNKQVGSLGHGQGWGWKVVATEDIDDSTSNVNTKKKRNSKVCI